MPSAVPVTGSAIEEAVATLRNTGKKDMPKYFEVPADKNGKPIMTDIDFYTKVIIGEAMPKDSTSMYNILLGLSQVQILNNETQQVEPLITPARRSGARGYPRHEAEDTRRIASENFVRTYCNVVPKPVRSNECGHVPQARRGHGAAKARDHAPQMPEGDAEMQLCEDRYKDRSVFNSFGLPDEKSFGVYKARYALHLLKVFEENPLIYELVGDNPMDIGVSYLR